MHNNAAPNTFWCGETMSHLSTCGVRLAVVLTTVLHFDRWQAEGLDHLVSALTPVRGAESQDGEGQRQSGQGQGQQGARATGHTLQHGHTGEEGGGGRPERERRGGRGDTPRGNRTNGTEGVTAVTDGAERVGQMLWGGFKRWWAARFKWKAKINVT